MKIISPKIHGVLDYVVVIFLIVAPYIFDLSPLAKTFSIVLGAIHFLLTIFTAFKSGLVKVIPFPIHGLIELLVSIALVILAFTIFSSHITDHFYYACLAVSIFIVFILTDYKAKTI